MNTIRLTELTCVDPEDWGHDGDEPALKIIIDGGKSFRVRVADHIREGETISLDYEYRFKHHIQIEIWDLDKGTWYDKHDFINKIRVTSYDMPGSWTYTMGCRNTEYKLSYSLETSLSKPSDPPAESPYQERKKIFEHFAGQSETAPQAWPRYSRDQVALEMKARFFHWEMSREEYIQLSSYPYSAFAYTRPFPYQGRTELCGPAAIAYDLFLADPTTYLSSLAALYEAGECPVGGLYLRPKEKLKRSYRKKITAIDWMFLASMREGRNKVFSIDSDSRWWAFFTPPVDMTFWLRRIYPNESIKQRLRFRKKDSNKAHRRAISEALRKDTRSFFLIDGKLITPHSRGNRLSRLHWIVIKPGSAKWTSEGKYVTFTFYTWGNEWTKTFSINELVRYLYVTIVRD